MNSLVRITAIGICAACSLGGSRIACAAESLPPMVAASAAAATKLKQAMAQAADPARAEETARLLSDVLQDWGPSLVALSESDDWFTHAGRATERAIFENAAVRTAYRTLEEKNARDLVEQGNLERAVETRLATMAGLDAALRLAQAQLARARFASALALLDRTARHDGLAGMAQFHHRAMTVMALAGLGEIEEAQKQMDALAASAGTLDATATQAALRAAKTELERAVSKRRAQAASDTWIDLWRAPLALAPTQRTGAANPFGALGADARVGLPVALPVIDLERVYADDGTGLAAWDALTGELLWHAESSAIPAPHPLGPALRCAGVNADAVVGYELRAGTPGTLRQSEVVCRDSATGDVRWRRALHLSDGASDAGGAIPIGEPLMLDGRVFVAARQTTAQQDSISWLLCMELSGEQPIVWATQLASAPARAIAGARALESPVARRGNIFVSTGTGAVARVDPSSGAVVWLHRFPIPLEDHRTATEPWDMLTPAVSNGRVIAVTPERTTLAVLDAETGRLVAQPSAAADTPFAGAAYAVGIPQLGLAAIVGRKVSVVTVGDALVQRWAWPAGDGAHNTRGRIAVGVGANAADSLLAIPAVNSTILVDAATGASRAELPCAGNAVLAQQSLASAGGSALEFLMPARVARAACLERMKSDSSVACALALIVVAERSGDAELAVSGAAEALKRIEAAVKAGADPELVAQARQDCFVAVDRAFVAMACDDPRAQLLADIHRDAAVAADAMRRAKLAQALRDERCGKATDAAVSLASLIGSGVEGGGTVVDSDAEMSINAMAEAHLRAIVGKTPDVIKIVLPVLEMSIAAAHQERSAPKLRGLARVAAIIGFDATVQLCLELLRGVDPGMAARVQTELRGAAAPKSEPGAPAAVTAIEFPGAYCPVALAGHVPTDMVFSVVDMQLVARRPPSFEPVWTAKLRDPLPTLVGSRTKVLVWEQTGGATLLDCTNGQPIWQSTEFAQLFEPRLPVNSPEGAPALTEEDAMPQVTIGTGASVPLSQVTPVACGDTLVFTRRDGAIVAVDATDGTTARWKRAGTPNSVVEFAATDSAIVVGTEQRDGEDSETFTTRPAVLALDALTGAELLNRPIPGDITPHLEWLTIAPGGLLVIGTDSGVEAWRLAGGDGPAPFWQSTGSALQFSRSAWAAGRWILVQAIHGELLALDAATGRTDPYAFHSNDTPLGAIRDIVSGHGWVAVVRDSSVDFFAPDGAFLGRDVPASERMVTFAFPMGARLVAVDAESDHLTEGSGSRSRAEMVLLEGASGGRTLDTPMSLAISGDPVQEARAVGAWIVLSNGTAIQAIGIPDWDPPSH